MAYLPVSSYLYGKKHRIMSNLQKKNLFILIVVATLATLPWLGYSDFNTKGEPREAIVSLTMLQQDNWILPHNNGGEMAYKPPFFHWCIAATATVLGGMSEWAARFPSALACILMLAWMYVYYTKRRDAGTALTASLICLGCFEIFRAAHACRVDMVLTFCIVGAIYAFARWTEHEHRRPVPWLAILMMSLGTLTKGPVAIVLPCGVTGLYLLLRRENFFRVFFSLAATALASLILPALWYYAAYQQGGEEFLRLVKEENIDRFLGKMSYASHENGLWYYFVMLPAGLLPWTLALLPALRKKCSLREIKEQMARIQPLELFSMVAATVIFVFYCIPKSKRGVYIMPMYPFTAYFIALYMQKAFSAKFIKRAICAAVGLFTLAFAVVLPSFILNKKSDLGTAQEIGRIVGNGYLTSHVSGGAPGNPMHFFTINYYMKDKVDVWKENGPVQEEGYLLIGEKDAPAFIQQQSDYKFSPVELKPHRSCDIKQNIQLYHFKPAKSK